MIKKRFSRKKFGCTGFGCTGFGCTGFGCTKCKGSRCKGSSCKGFGRTRFGRTRSRKKHSFGLLGIDLGVGSNSSTMTLALLLAALILVRAQIFDKSIEEQIKNSEWRSIVSLSIESIFDTLNKLGFRDQRLHTLILMAIIFFG